MLHSLDWDDDEVVTKTTGTVADNIKPFNPRIRIIGIAQPDLPKATPVLAWDDSEVTALRPRVTSAVASAALDALGPVRRPLPPPRAPRKRRPSEPAPADAASSPEADDSEPETVEPIAEAPRSQAVAVAPIIDVLAAAADEAVAADDDPATSWEEQDDVTVPQRFGDLRERARALTGAWEDTEAPWLDERSAELSFDEAQDGGPAAPDSEPELLRLGAMGDTLVDLVPPSAVLAQLEDAEASLASPPRTEADDALQMADGERDSEGPQTQPSTPPPALAPPSEIDVDLTDLYKSRVLHVAELAPLGDLYADEHTPIPVARRPDSLFISPPPLGSVGDSLHPVAVSDPPSPQRRGPMLGLGLAVAAMCCAVLTVMLWPRDGSLLVRLQTADGNPTSKAEIYVDGQKRCDTDPCVVRNLSSGTKTIKVILPGVDIPRVATAEVLAGEQASVTIAVPSGAVAQGLEISSDQAGVALQIDNTDGGVLPVTLTDLSAGKHHLRFTKDGFAPQERDVTVVAGELLDVGKISLSPTGPRLVINVETDGARVVLIGPTGHKRVLRGPFPMSLDLAPGRYKLVASQAGFWPWVRRYTLDAAGAERRVSVDLAPATGRRGNSRKSAAKPETTSAAGAAPAGDPYDGLD